MKENLSNQLLSARMDSGKLCLNWIDPRVLYRTAFELLKPAFKILLATFSSMPLFHPLLLDQRLVDIEEHVTIDFSFVI